MMKPLLILPLFVTSIAHAAEPTVTLAGVQTVFDDGEKEFDGFKTYNMPRGHSVALIVRSKGKMMVDFDDDKAKVTLGGAKAECIFFGNMGISKDRLAMKLEFTTSAPVQMDAEGKFKVEGGLPIVFASGKGETRSAPFKVKEGVQIPFADGTQGMPTLKVKSIAKPDFGDEKMEIEFTTDRRVDEFAGFRFYDKEGKPVEAERAGSSWMSFGGKGSGEVSYRFKDNQADLILAVENWTGREEITVKVDLSAGLVPPKQ